MGVSEVMTVDEYKNEYKIEASAPETGTFGKKEKKRLAINIAAMLLMLIAGILIVSFHGFPEKQAQDATASFSAVDKICELATLKCYYHNVAELEKEPAGLFKYGFKKLWVEYTGTIEVGIDVDSVQVNDPDEDNVVYVYVPDARITKVSADSDSMSEPISDTGVFTKITADDQTQAFTEAQKKMQEEAEADTAILNQAKSNAKKLLEQYIINVGNEIGETYTVKWLDEPKQ